MTERAQSTDNGSKAARARAERDAKLRAAGVDPAQVIDERDVEYILGDAFRKAGVEYGEKEQAAVVCTLLGYRYPDALAVGDRPPEVVLHPLDGGDAVPIGRLHRDRPLVLFFGSYT
jgi:hypothetical protein